MQAFIYTHYMPLRLVQLISHLICYAHLIWPTVWIEIKPLIYNGIKLLLYNIVSTEIPINSFVLQLVMVSLG